MTLAFYRQEPCQFTPDQNSIVRQHSLLNHDQVSTAGDLRLADGAQSEPLVCYRPLLDNGPSEELVAKCFHRNSLV